MKNFLLVIICLSTPRLLHSAIVVTPQSSQNNCIHHVTIKNKKLDNISIAGKNIDESQESKNYRKNMDNLNLKIATLNNTGDRFINDSFVPDLQREFIGSAFSHFKGGEKLESLLYNTDTLSRKDIKDWVNEYIPEYEAIFVDEIQEQLQTSPKLKNIIPEDKKDDRFYKIKKENGFVGDGLYFSLIKNKYIPIGNDHDVLVHLLLYSDERTRSTTISLADKMMEKLNNLSIGGGAEILEDIASLKLSWAMFQEKRVFRNLNEVFFLGGLYSAQMNNIAKGNFKNLSPFANLWDVFSRNARISHGMENSNEFQRFLNKLGYENFDDFIDAGEDFNIKFNNIAKEISSEIESLGPQKAITRLRLEIYELLKDDSFFNTMIDEDNYHELFEHFFKIL